MRSTRNARPWRRLPTPRLHLKSSGFRPRTRRLRPTASRHRTSPRDRQATMGRPSPDLGRWLGGGSHFSLSLKRDPEQAKIDGLFLRHSFVFNSFQLALNRDLSCSRERKGDQRQHYRDDAQLTGAGIRGWASLAFEKRIGLVHLECRREMIGGYAGNCTDGVLDPW